MELILGIDIGGSTTKIVAMTEQNEVIDMLRVSAKQQLTAIYGAIGSLLQKNGIKLPDIKKIVLTGVGAEQVEGDIYGIPTCKVKEFEAVGTGALFLTKLEKALVVSMGTGTSFVNATNNSNEHLGGSGVGGGTLVQLASRLCGEQEMDAIVALAKEGNLEHVDLLIEDVSKSAISFLPADATATNFGKITSKATKADFSLGLMNMIYQTAGTMAIFLSNTREEKTIIVTGSLATLPQAETMLGRVGDLYGYQFLIPENAPFATAIGAALCR